MDHQAGGDLSGSGYLFARRPIWLIGHVIALAAVVGFVLLGFWQLRRHDERQALDRQIATRVATPPQPLDEVIAAVGADPDALELRRVIVSGTYRTGDEVILQARSLAGRSGHEVLTPLDLGDGTAIMVDRGWVPIDVAGPPVVGAEPPAGRVEVVGHLRPAEVRQGIGPADPAQGRLDRVSRVDIGRLRQQIELDLLEVYLVLSVQEPAQAGDLPIPLPTPAPGGGPPHLGYAVQWFAFAAVVAIGYPALVLRTARRSLCETPLE